MKRLIWLVLVFTVLYPILGEEPSLSKDQADAKALVDKAAALIQDLGEEALAKVSDPEGGFYLKDRAIYVFVYDPECVVLAHPVKNSLIGMSLKGKPDARGKKFRDEIVKKAIEDGDGWTTYSYQKPGEEGIHPKIAYGKLAEHQGKQFIVVAGVYYTN